MINYNSKEDILLFVGKSKNDLNDKLKKLIANRFRGIQTDFCSVLDGYKEIDSKAEEYRKKGVKNVFLVYLTMYSEEKEKLNMFIGKLSSKKGITIQPINIEISLIDIYDILELEVKSNLNYLSSYNDTSPSEIQRKSFNLIDNILSDIIIDSTKRKIITRVIHTTADFSISKMIYFSENAIESGKRALNNGSRIITDVNMVAAGIKTLFKRRTLCKVSTKKAMKLSKKLNISRAAAGFEILKEKIDKSIVAIGNAPTALIHLIRMIKKYPIKPALIVGVPVGFIGAAEAKELLIESGCEYITIRGIRGGSNIASAIINALGSL